MTDRDSKTGRFLPGHKVVVPRDTLTGCFISVAEFRYRKAVCECDFFLDGRMAG